jgi:hypothetical protein
MHFLRCWATNYLTRYIITKMNLNSALVPAENYTAALRRELIYRLDHLGRQSHRDHRVAAGRPASWLLLVFGPLWFGHSGNTVLSVAEKGGAA